MRIIPKIPEFLERFGPRGVLHCFASDRDDPTVEPRWGRVGKQRINRAAYRKANGDDG